MALLKSCFQLFRFTLIFMILHQFVMFDCASRRTTRAPVSKPGTAISTSKRMPIGVIFDQNSDQIQKTFKIAVDQHTTNKTPNDVNFQVFIDLIHTADVFKLSRLICNQFARGVVAILAAVQPDSFDTFHSYTNAFHMPFVAPFFPVKVRSTTSGMPDYAVSILPDYHKAVLDTVTFYGWQNVIYLYDSDDGVLRLEQLYKSMMPGKKPYFRIAYTRKIKTARDVIVFLKELEKYDQWSNKYVILDCTTTLAKETLMAHVRDLTLGRRNYHYLFTGLVLDDLWESNIEYNSINITGFKLVDTTRKFVKDILKLLKVNYISASAALMYDATHTLLEAYERIFKQKPHIIGDLMNMTNDHKRFLSCDIRSHVSLIHGDEITELLKKIELEGLTGKIRFSNGVRKGFSLMVFRNSPGSGVAKIATWYDDRGFRPVKKLNGLDISGNENMTYTVLSIEEPPYFTTTRQRKNKNSKDLGEIQYGGFCADLAILIAEKLGINIEFRLSADGKYGGVNPNVIGGWDGMVGELSRKEVDMVIAPLIVTREREAVIDFSKPFLSFNRINEKSETKKNDLMSLLRPLSKETWILLASSMILVSVVMYVVSRFSPIERRIVTVPDPAPGLEADEDNSRPAVINEFSFFNSVWYVVSSIMQQGSHVSPRSLSLRILTIFWWFYTLIIVCSYTAYLASQLTVNSISSQHTATYNRMAHCPEDMDGNNKEEIIAEEEEGYGNLDDTYIPQPKDYQKGCEMLVSVVDPGIKDFAVGFAKGSRLRTNVNVALTIIREEGELKRLLRKHFQKTSCELTETTGGGSELKLQDVVGLFYVLVIGLVIALVVAMFEFCKRYRSDVAKSKVPIKTGSDTNSRIQLNEIQETRDTTRRRRRDQERWNGGDNTPGSYAGLNVPCSSPSSTMKQNVRCIGVRRGMTRQRSHPVVDEAEAIQYQQYFTPNSNGPEEAALRNSYTQV